MARRFPHVALALGLIAFGAQPAHSQLSSVGIGAFAGATVVDFNGLADETQISNQFAGQGVTFGGALYATKNSGDLDQFPANGGGTIGSNWLYSVDEYQGLAFTAVFTQARNQVGFWLENWPTQTGILELFMGATSLGTINFGPTAEIRAEFFGVSSVQSFDNLTFKNSTQLNGYFGIDDFQFDGSANTSVPEPGSLVLVGAGLLGVIGAGMRRRRAQ